MVSKKPKLRICVAGATGKVGRCLVAAVLADDDMVLASAVSRGAAGQDVGRVAGMDPVGIAVSATVETALDAGVDVLIDYTHPTAIRGHVDAAIARGVSVVVGTSGLRHADYPRIATAARAANVGVVTGNFALTAALMQHLAKIAARHMPQWEVVEYNHATKPDAPSATGVELAEMLSAIHPPEVDVADAAFIGEPEARGANVLGTRVHSLRLRGIASACEVIFAMAGQRLTIRHDAEAGGEAFVEGSLIAARAAGTRPGLTRGLDTLLFEFPEKAAN